jgi:hypothetical protein
MRRHGTARSGARARLGVQGARHRAAPTVWGGVQPLERASGWGAASADETARGGRDGGRQPRRRGHGGRGEGSGAGSSGDRRLSAEEAFASWREGGAVHHIWQITVASGMIKYHIAYRTAALFSLSSAIFNIQ